MAQLPATGDVPGIKVYHGQLDLGNALFGQESPSGGVILAHVAQKARSTSTFRGRTNDLPTICHESRFGRSCGLVDKCKFTLGFNYSTLIRVNAECL